MTASARTIDAHLGALPPDRRAALERLRKGTIRFQPEQPLPAVLVRTLVRARIAELQ